MPTSSCLTCWPHIPRDELDGGLHFGHHALGFLETLQAGLAELFLLGNGADRVDVALDIPGNELAVATHAALQVDKVVGVADGADALGDLLALPGEALVLVASGCPRPAPPAPGSRPPLEDDLDHACASVVVSGVEVLLHPLERLFRLREALAAARCLAASGAETALLSSCCTWKRSGE